MTLVTDDDKEINAHKTFLSSCSTIIKNILLTNSHLHPQNSFNDEEFTDVTLVTDDDKEIKPQPQPPTVWFTPHLNHVQCAIYDIIM